jgi:hypothetical protein
LKEFFPSSDTRIDDGPCLASSFDSVQLYENGRLKACTLSETIVRHGQTYDKGSRVRFDSDGRIVP